MVYVDLTGLQYRLFLQYSYVYCIVQMFLILI